MTTSTMIPGIKTFPKDGRVWRIDWLGAINSNTQRSVEPTIDVIISPLESKQVQALTSDNSRRGVIVGVGLLPFLRIGSLWLDGLPYPDFLGSNEELLHIEIAEDTITNIHANDLDSTQDEIRAIIPWWEYDVGDAGRESQCIAIQYEKDPFGIILPSIEAIRFYYAGSTNLTSMTLFGAYENYLNDIINVEKSGFLEEHARCILQLRRWITDDDGWTIGRVLHDKFARAGVRQVYDSILPYSMKGEPVYPKCGLPFEGEVNWVARGKWIKSGLEPGRRFIVFELIRCSSPFPFDELHVIRDNDGRQAAEDTDIPEVEKMPAWGVPRVARLPGEKEALLQSEEDPQKGIAPMYVPLIGDRFDALDGKEIIKTEKEEAPYKGVRLSSLLTVSPESYSTGEEVSGEHPVGAVKIQEARRRKGIAPSFDILIKAAELINSQDGFRASMRSTRYDQFLTPPLSSKARKPWPYLDYKADRLRCVWAIDVEYRGGHYCFIDFELRKKNEHTAALVRHLAGNRLSKSDFSIILHLISATKGRWDRSRFARHGMLVTKRKHTWSDAMGCAKAVVDMITRG